MAKYYFSSVINRYYLRKIFCHYYDRCGCQWQALPTVNNEPETFLSGFRFMLVVESQRLRSGRAKKVSFAFVDPPLSRDRRMLITVAVNKHALMRGQTILSTLASEVSD